MAENSAVATYQLKVALERSKPPIWRRILVPSDIKLNVFHAALQYSMGWLDCHLHQFEKDRMILGVPDDDFGLEIEDEKKFRLSDLLTEEKETLIYEYDFGDSWRHKITLEKILPFEKSSQLVRCIKGKKSCPPEDCGGIWRYGDLLKVISDPSHSEYDEMIAWLGDHFNPDHFSLSETNKMLSAYVK